MFNNWRCAGLLWLGSFAACAAPRPTPPPPLPTTCPFPKDWVQATLDLWERTAKDLLKKPAAPLPHMVYFDARCSYAVAAPAPPTQRAEPILGLRFQGAPVAAWSIPHQGKVELPNGQQIPPGMYAAASLYGSPPSTPFYAMALLDIWSSQLPADKQDEYLSEEFLTIAQHELTHTLQLRGMFHAAQRIAKQGGTKREFKLDDDQIQALFEGDATYVAAFSEEVRLLYSASLASTVADKKRLARRAYELARARQARYFVGQHQMFAELDGLFLSMEGLGEWVRYQHLTAGPVGRLPRQSRSQAIARLQGKKPYWSQDEGLALLLVLAELHPTFQARLLAEDLPDALTLLEEATR